MFQTIQKMKVRENRGFTLIELLIVVAIIGILAAIAIPAFLGQQKKAKWRSLLGSCEGANKQAAAMLNDLAKLDPIVLLDTPSTRKCFFHISKPQVDTNADGTPETDTCPAKFAGMVNDGSYGDIATGTVIHGLAFAIASEACGGLPVASLDALGAPAGPPFAGLGKVSPYNESKCLFAVADAFVADTYSGQCLMIPAEDARTVQSIAIEDKGDATDGETKSWTAAAE